MKKYALLYLVSAVAQLPVAGWSLWNHRWPGAVVNVVLFLFFLVMSWYRWTLHVAGSVSSNVIEFHQKTFGGKMWLLQATEDLREAKLTPFTPETEKADDGRPFTFRHVFFAEDFHSAIYQMQELRFSPPKVDQKSMN